MTTIPPPKYLLVPLSLPQKYLFGAGPSNTPTRILNAVSLPTIGHLHNEFCEVMDAVKDGLRYAWQTTNAVTLAVSGTGHAAMEAAIVNMTEPGDVVLVGVNGLWGHRATDMAVRVGGIIKQLKKPLGEVFTLEDIEKGLKMYRPAVLFLTHGESSSGTCQPLDGVADLCHRYNCLVIVDSVASFGGVPLHVDELGLDVVYSCSQKALSCPPGASPITLSPRAWKKLINRNTKPSSFYLDLTLLANYWGCDGSPRRYHHTAQINNIYALRESLAAVVEEGIENRWQRHRDCTHLLWKGLEKMGLEMFVKEENERLLTITTVVIPQGVNGKDVSGYLMKKYLIELPGGLGESAGKIWRIGLMGHNSTPDNVALILRALQDGISWCSQQKSNSMMAKL